MQRRKTTACLTIHDSSLLKRFESVHFLEMDTLKLAQMITLVDSQLYRCILVGLFNILRSEPDVGVGSRSLGSCCRQLGQENINIGPSM